MLDLGCICHLENLAVKSAMKSLPININSLLVDINTHFYMSVKKLKEFCDFVIFYIIYIFYIYFLYFLFFYFSISLFFYFLCMLCSN